QRFLIALRFEGNSRQLHVQRDGDGRRHHEYQQQRKSTFPLHPACSCCKMSVCRLFLYWVSSMITEFTWICTTRYRFLTISPSAATKISSPSRKKARFWPSARGVE